MFRTSKRSKAPKPTTGPRLGAFVASNGTVTVRIVATGERPSLPRASVLASSAGREAVASAAALVAARVQAHANRPVTVTVLA